VELLKDDGQVVLDGLFRETEHVGNRFVGRALGNQTQDLDLSLVQIKELLS